MNQTERTERRLKTALGRKTTVVYLSIINFCVPEKWETVMRILCKTFPPFCGSLTMFGNQDPVEICNKNWRKRQWDLKTNGGRARFEGSEPNREIVTCAFKPFHSCSDTEHVSKNIEKNSPSMSELLHRLAHQFHPISMANQCNRTRVFPKNLRWKVIAARPSIYMANLLNRAKILATKIKTIME